MTPSILNRFASWLLGKTESRAIGKPAMPWEWTSGSGAGSTYNYNTYIRDGFHANPIIYACLDMIARTTATIRVAISVNGEILEPDKIPNDLQPLQALLTQPNPNQAWKEFIEEWSINQNVGGAAYIHGIGIGTQRLGDFERTLTDPEMWLIKPDRVKLLKDGPLVVGFRIDSVTNRTTDEMFFTAFPTGLNDSEGLSALKAASRSGDAHSAAIRWNERLLSNSGAPSGLVAIQGMSSWTIPEREHFEEEWQKRYGGPDNVGKIAAIPADGLTYTPFAMSPKDMDWLGGKQDFMRDICAALGVPSTLLNDPNSRTYSNYKEARKALYQEKTIPDMTHWVTEFNHFIKGRFRPGTRIVLVTDHIDVLRADQDALVTRLKTADWMTPNEKRAAMGLEDIEGGDILPIPFNYVPITLIAGGAGKASERSGETRSISKASLYQTEEQRQAAFDRHDRTRRVFEKRYEAKVSEYLNEQVNEIAKLLIEKATETFVRSGKHDIPDNFIQLIFDFEFEAQRYVEEFEALQIALTIEFGQAAINQLIAEGVLFDIERPALKQFIALDLAARSKLINGTTATQMQGIINTGLAENEGIYVIRDRLLNQFGDLSVARARMIAQTEVGRAATQATLEGFKQIGVQQDEWLSARDADVRDTHIVMDGQVVNLGDDFTSPSGAAGPGPGLLNDPAEDIHCRCVLVPLAVGEDKI